MKFNGRRISKARATLTEINGNLRQLTEIDRNRNEREASEKKNG